MANSTPMHLFSLLQEIITNINCTVHYFLFLVSLLYHDNQNRQFWQGCFITCRQRIMSRA